MTTKDKKLFQEYLDTVDAQTKTWSKTIDKLVEFVNRNKEGVTPLNMFIDFRKNVESYFHTLNNVNKRVKELETELHIKEA